jgi:hypothetical protein
MAHVIVDNAIELTWLALAMAAFAMYSIALREAVIDSAYVLAAGWNGRRKLIADENIREELKRSFIAFINGAGAIASMFLPSHRVGIGVGIATMAIMILFACLNRLTRRKLSAYSGDETPPAKVSA